MSITGSWQVVIATPIGQHHVVLELVERNGMVEGQARGEGETTPLLDVVLIGNRLTWHQRITKPMRLNLAFDVTFVGDTLQGTSKAGLLPSSSVAGSRIRSAT